jgi:DNA-binding protein Fis
VEHFVNNARAGETAESLESCIENAFVKGHSIHEITEMIRKIAEKRIIARVYEQCHRNKRRTCEALGLDYSTLYRKMKEHALM